MSWLGDNCNPSLLENFCEFVPPSNEGGAAGGSGSAGGGGGDDHKKIGAMEAYRFDFSALERAAQAAKSLEKSSNAKECLELSRQQEITKQNMYLKQSKEFEVQARQMEMQVEKTRSEERMKQIREQANLDKQKVQYQDQLARSRYEDQLEQQRRLNEENLRRQEQSVEKQEAMRRATLEYELEKRAELDMKRIEQEVLSKGKVERENQDLTLEQIRLKAKEDRETQLESIKAIGSLVGQGFHTFPDDEHRLRMAVAGLVALSAGYFAAKGSLGIAFRLFEAGLGKASKADQGRASEPSPDGGTTGVSNPIPAPASNACATSNKAPTSSKDVPPPVAETKEKPKPRKSKGTNVKSQEMNGVAAAPEKPVNLKDSADHKPAEKIEAPLKRPTENASPACENDVATVKEDSDKPSVSLAKSEEKIGAYASPDSEEKCDPSTDSTHDTEGEVEKSAKPAASSPAYSYRENQWSPHNLTGVKSYDNFMLKAYAFATELPKNLASLEELEHQKREKARSSSQSQSRDGNLDDFTPAFVRNTGGMGGHKSGYSGQMHRGSNSTRGGKKVPKVIDVKPIAGKINLKTTDNAWVPVSKASTSVDEEAKLLRSMRSLMNKICPENYKKLKDPFRNMILKNNRHMKALVNLIFNKAVLEQHFAGEYAKLCKYVVEKVDSKNAILEIQVFRNSLLHKCQQEYEKRHKEEAQRLSDIQKSREAIAKCQNSEEKARLEKEHEEKFVDKVAEHRERLSKEIEECKSKEKKKLLEEELETLDDATRRKSVGLIKYVAELYKQGLLSYRTILGLFKDLVKDIHRTEQAEILCKLFITIGGLLWVQVDEHGKKTIKSCMNDVKQHSQVVKDSRIKFMLLDVIDLYDNNFVAKHRSQKQVGPTTKKQVLENISVKQRQMEKETAAAASRTSGNRHSKGNYGGRYYRGNNNRNSFNQKSTHTWKVVVHSSQAAIHITSSNPMSSNRFGVLKDYLGVPELQSRHPLCGTRTNPFTKSSNSDNDRSSDVQGAYGDSRDQMRGESHSGAMYQPGKAAAPPPRDESPPLAALSDEQLKTMVLSTVGEYCDVGIIKEVILDIHNKIQVQNLKMFVYYTMFMYFEKEAMDIETIGVLFNELFNEMVLVDSDIVESIKNLMPEVAELAVDVPKLAQNFGTMIAPSVISGHLKLKDIWNAVQGADSSYKIKLFCYTLQKMACLEEDETFRLWISSDLKWEEIFKVEKKQRPYVIPDECRAYRLDFLPTSKDETMSDYYHQWCKRQKDVNIRDSKSVKALVTKLITPTVKGSDSSAEIDDFDGLCDRLEGLKKFIEQEECDRQQVELAVLYAMEAIACKNGEPKGLLECMFSAANNTCIVSWTASVSDSLPTTMKS